jgi:prefoldin subunit 5
VNSNTNIVIITDVLEMRQRKEEELAYYQEQLEILTQKMQWVRHEIDITNHIIDLIEQEKCDINIK